MSEINFRKTKFLKVASKVADCPDLGVPEIVLCGRSNVGKSSLVNALADNKKLARTSQTPGKTREVVYFDVDSKILLADLPGYGFSKASKEKSSKFSALCDDYFTVRGKADLALLLLDIRIEPTSRDIMMLEYLNSAEIPYFVVFTKCDKMSKMQVKLHIEKMARSLKFSKDARVFAISSEKKLGLEDLKEALSEYFAA